LYSKHVALKPIDFIFNKKGFYVFLNIDLNKMIKVVKPKKSHKRRKSTKYHQGYNDRKDESIAMRIRKPRTRAQLKASANESYGRWGSKAKKSGKINRSKRMWYDYGRSSRGVARRTTRRTKRRSSKRAKKNVKAKYGMSDYGSSSRGVARRTTRRTKRRSSKRAKKNVKAKYV
jgi:hypothetical protein